MSIKDTMSKVETQARAKRRELDNASTHGISVQALSSSEMLWFVERQSKAILDLQAQVDDLQERIVTLETKPKRKYKRKKNEKPEEQGDAS